MLLFRLCICLRLYHKHKNSTIVCYGYCLLLYLFFIFTYFYSFFVPFRCEDERFEVSHIFSLVYLLAKCYNYSHSFFFLQLDVVLESNASTIKALEAVQKKLSRLVICLLLQVVYLIVYDHVNKKLQ